MGSHYRRALTRHALTEKWKKSLREYEPKTNSTMYALHSVTQHWVENEALIEQAAKEEVEQNGPKWKPKDDEEIGEFLAEKDQARIMHDDIMIPIHRYSCIVMLYTTVERELKRLVENLEKERGPQKLKLKDISGASLDRAAKFVEVFYGLRLGDCPQYAALHDLQKIRDCIIHCLGEVRLSNDKDYLVKLETKRHGFFAHPQSDIKIQSECIEQFLREIWSFFTWIFSKLNWKLDSFYQGNRLEQTLKGLKYL
jgi:uncharacterized protein with PIN domain